MSKNKKINLLLSGILTLGIFSCATPTTAKKINTDSSDIDVDRALSNSTGSFADRDIQYLNVVLAANSNIKTMIFNQDIVNKLIEYKKTGKNLKDFFKVIPANAVELNKAGYKLKELKEAGVPLKDVLNIRPISPKFAKEIKEAGFTIKDLKDSGLHIIIIRADFGYTLKELKAGGFTNKDMLLLHKAYLKNEIKTLGLSIQELLDIGFDSSQFFLDLNIKRESVLKEIRARKQPVKVYRDFILSAKEAKEAGNNDIEEFTKAGYTLEELKNIGFSLKELKKVGLTASDIIKNNSYTLKEMKDVGFTIKDFYAINFMGMDYFGRNPESTLKSIGYTDKELKAGGFYSELKYTGIGIKHLKSFNVSILELKEAGWNAIDLFQSGYTNKEIKNAGFSAKDMKQILPNALNKDFKNEDKLFTAKEMKDAGFTAKELFYFLYTAKELQEAGFTLREILNEYHLDEIKDVDFTIKKLKEAGFNENEILNAI